MTEIQDTNRRQFLRQGLMIASAVALAPVAGAFASTRIAMPETRSLSLKNLHTGESVAVNYVENGQYVPGALAKLNQVLRDHRTGDVHKIDPHLFDIMVGIQRKLGIEGQIEIISGYRSPASNAMLRGQSSGVAKKSLHMEGMAIDMRMPQARLACVRQAALDIKKGGVGYYPGSNFVHVDTGAVRQWVG